MMNWTIPSDNSTINHTQVDGSPVDLHKVFIFYYVFRFIESLLTIIGNGLTILIVVRTPALHTPSSAFLVSLSIADLAVGFTTPLAFAVAIFDQQPSWLYLCLVKDTFYMSSVCGNVFSVTAIAVDRHVAVYSPLRYDAILTPTVVKTSVATIWTLTLLLVVPSIIFGNNLQLDKLCAFGSYLNKTVYIAYSTIYVSLMISTAVLYSRVACMAWSKSRRVAPGETSCSNDDIIRHQIEKQKELSQRRITKTMGLVVGLYFVLSIPALIAGFVVGGRSLPLWAYYVYHLCLLLWWANALVNPIIYALRYQKFREAYRKMFSLKR